jgi:hypothetical protein
MFFIPLLLISSEYKSINNALKNHKRGALSPLVSCAFFFIYLTEDKDKNHSDTLPCSPRAEV